MELKILKVKLSRHPSVEFHHSSIKFHIFPPSICYPVHPKYHGRVLKPPLRSIIWSTLQCKGDWWSRPIQFPTIASKMDKESRWFFLGCNLDLIQTNSKGGVGKYNLEGGFCFRSHLNTILLNSGKNNETKLLPSIRWRQSSWTE